MKLKLRLGKTTLVKLIAIGFCPALAITAHAATATWDGAFGGVWDMSTTANWTGTTFGSGDDAVFSGMPINNVATATGLTIGTITLNSDFTGSVAMTGSNTVSGATTISGGTLNLTNVGGLGSSAVTVNSGGTLLLNAGNNVTYSNTISGAGAISVTPGANDAFITSNLSGFTGTLTLNASGGANSGKTRFTTSQANVMSSSGTIDVLANTTLYLNQALNYGASINLFGAGNNENLGALRLESAANQTGSVTLRANSFIGVNASGATISGNIGESGGSFGFTKQGNNTLTLSGSNSYSGTTTVSAGTVSVGNNTALGTGAVAISGGNLSNTTGVTLANNFTLNNATTFTAGSGILTLNGNITGATSLSLTPTNKITLAGTNSFATSAGFGNLTVNAGAGGVDITGSTTVGNGNSADSGGYLDIHGTTTVTVQSGGSLSILGTTHANKPGAIVGQNAAGTSTLVVNGGSLTLGGNLGWAFGNNVGTAIGVLTISSGTATITAGSATLQNTLNFVALGRDAATGIINLDGGTLATGRQFVRDGSSGGTAGSGTATFNFNGGTLQAQADQTSGNGWFETATTGNFQVVTTTVKAGGAKIDTNSFNTNINTVLAHDSGLGVTPDGGLTKSGSGTLSLGGTNSYTGDTTVTGGVLAVNGSSIVDTNKLVISGGKVEPTGTEVVDTLFFGATQQASGTWGSTTSGATHQDDTRFSGTGVVSVTTAPAAGGYTSWANANGATGQTKDLDHDNDGVDNGVEYFMGQTGSTFTANPAPVGDSVTWPMSATYTGVYGTDYEVQYSTDLVVWTQAPIGSGDNTVAVTAGTSVVYNMPTGGKSFVRLVVKN